MKKLDKFFLSEIGIEFKAALYFYSMLFFYIGHSLFSGRHQLEIFTVLQMIASTYIMGFVQVYLLGNFDEAERVGWHVVLTAAGCAFTYCAVSWLLDWFGRSASVTAAFFFFMLASFGCTWWLYSYRRAVTTRQLNAELEAFKKHKVSIKEENV